RTRFGVDLPGTCGALPFRSTLWLAPFFPPTLNSRERLLTRFVSRVPKSVSSPSYPFHASVRPEWAPSIGSGPTQRKRLPITPSSSLYSSSLGSTACVRLSTVGRRRQGFPPTSPIAVDEPSVPFLILDPLATILSKLEPDNSF